MRDKGDPRSAKPKIMLTGQIASHSFPKFNKRFGIQWVGPWSHHRLDRGHFFVIRFVSLSWDFDASLSHFLPFYSVW